MRLKTSPRLLSTLVCWFILSGAPVPNLFAQEVIEVGIATASALKVNAVQAALKEALPGQEFNIHPFKAASNIADQPVAEKWGVQGARNRIVHAKALEREESRPAGGNRKPIAIWVSMENYIEKTPVGWIDRAAVVVENSSPRREVLKFSDSIRFDEKFAREAQVRGEALDRKSKNPAVSSLESGYSVTSGEVIHDYYLAEKGVDLPKDNWHGYKDFGGVSRDKLLQATIVSALKELIPYADIGAINNTLRSASKGAVSPQAQQNGIDAMGTEQRTKDLPEGADQQVVGHKRENGTRRGAKAFKAE